MILEMKPLSMPEAKELLGSLEDKEDLIAQINKFTKLKPEDAKELREDLQKLDMIKVKPEHLVKIIDLLPEDASDLNKVFSEVSLDENEIKKILEIVKKYK